MENADIRAVIEKYQIQGYDFIDIKCSYICPKCIRQRKITNLKKTPFCPQCGAEVSYPEYSATDKLKLYEFNGVWIVDTKEQA